MSDLDALFKAIIIVMFSIMCVVFGTHIGHKQGAVAVTEGRHECIKAFDEWVCRDKVSK